MTQDEMVALAEKHAETVLDSLDGKDVKDSMLYCALLYSQLVQTLAGAALNERYNDPGKAVTMAESVCSQHKGQIYQNLKVLMQAVAGK